jgi:polyisoprenoid-binding protein YceI
MSVPKHGSVPRRPARSNSPGPGRREAVSTMSISRAAWLYISRWPLTAVLLSVVWILSASGEAQRTPIDPTHSTVTVRVYKSGLFSGLAHDHEIQAPVAAGSIDAREKAVQISFKVADMKVIDTSASQSERQEIEATMKGPKVLDVAQFPEISFASIRVASSGSDRSEVTGMLKLHGVSREIAVPVVLHDGKYSGSVTLKQTDYGITPVKIAGGAVKVKDEIVIEFNVSP